MDASEMHRRFTQAQQCLAGGDPRGALAIFRPVAHAAAGNATVQEFMAQILAGGGDLPGAVAALRSALRCLPAKGRATAQVGVQLARALTSLQQPSAAEAALRGAMDADASFRAARLDLARLLIATGRPAEALPLLGDAADVDAPSAQLRTQALNALGRKEEALAAAGRVTELNPGGAVGWHNLAGLQGDLRRYAEAERSTARALQLGVKAPETWLVRGRALVGLDRLDEAHAAFETALDLRADDTEAHRELARLIWVRTADVERATARLKAAIAADPPAFPLAVEHARILEYGGEPEAGARRLAEAADRPDAPAQLKAMAAQAALSRQPERAIAWAQAAQRAEPENPDMLRTLVEANLALGDARAARALADELAVRRPSDQGALALQAAARRLGGEDPPLPWEDYNQLVRGRFIDAPSGWPTLEAYLAALAGALTRQHGATRTHPVGQSVRGGTQTNQNLLESTDPAIQAFPSAIEGAIREYLVHLGDGDDPIRRRNTGDYRITGMWSVRLAADGFHTNHVHPEGWISSACHIVVPAAVDSSGQEGWLAFGQPGPPTRPSLAPELLVKPQPGRLVLFPSCVWHGTTPFTGSDVRLTVAFDLAPK